MKILYWNMHKMVSTELLAAMLREHDIDLMILSEFEGNVAKLLQSVNAGVDWQYRLVPSVWDNQDPLILGRFPDGSFTDVTDLSHGRIVALEPPGKVEVLLVVVHLASKLYRNETDQTALAGRVRVDIEEAEARRQHCRTVVVGDFNMNPFESGVVGSEAFHAVMCREVASKGSREVAGQERFFFYNPMWSLFGDRSVGPPGTYHYNSGAVDNYYWNMFDQVLLRPGLITRFIDEDLLIVTEVDGRSLLTARGLPDKNVGSDHLPIMFGLNLL